MVRWGVRNSTNGTLTEPASKYIDSYIKPFVKNLPSFIEDSVDVINGLSNLGDVSGQYLITCDVESLYTTIDHKEGLEAVRHYLCERVETTPPSDFLLQLTEFIIHNNVFMFLYCLTTHT